MLRGTNVGGGVTGTGAVGAAVPSGLFGKGIGAGLAGAVVKLTPWAREPNGPVISSDTSSFCAGRRASREGLICARMRFNGKVTGRGSCSPPEFAKSPGAAKRSSPKVILTAPCASCTSTLSIGIEKVASGAGGWTIFARNSIGRADMTGWSGSCKSPVDEVFAGAGGGVGKPAYGLGGGVAGWSDTDAAAGLATGRDGLGADWLSPSSKCRSNPLSSPVNLDFTMFGMAD